MTRPRAKSVMNTVDTGFPAQIGGTNCRHPDALVLSTPWEPQPINTAQRAQQLATAQLKLRQQQLGDTGDGQHVQLERSNPDVGSSQQNNPEPPSPPHHRRKSLWLRRHRRTATTPTTFETPTAPRASTPPRPMSKSGNGCQPTPRKHLSPATTIPGQLLPNHGRSRVEPSTEVEGPHQSAHNLPRGDFDESGSFYHDSPRVHQLSKMASQTTSEPEPHRSAYDRCLDSDCTPSEQNFPSDMMSSNTDLRGVMSCRDRSGWGSWAARLGEWKHGRSHRRRS